MSGIVGLQASEGYFAEAGIPKATKKIRKSRRKQIKSLSRGGKKKSSHSMSYLSLRGLNSVLRDIYLRFPPGTVMSSPRRVSFRL